MDDKFQWPGNPLTIEELTAFAREAAKDADYKTAKFVNLIHMHTIIHFLGKEWYLRYASLYAEKDSYLSPAFRPDGTAPIYSMRILNLAEMLFNLQGVEGFQHCLAQLATGQIESGLAELQLGMMLYQAHLKIRYIDPSAVLGKTYDLEIDFPSATSCAEIKCKKDLTDLSVETVRNSLSDARTQLPAGGDGIVFVKVPQSWARATGEEIFLSQAIADTTAAFLRSTTRVSLVTFYVFHLSEISGGVLNRHAVREFPSPRKSDGGPWGKTLFPFNLPIKWVSMPDLIKLWTENAG